MYPSTYDWGNIDQHKFDATQLAGMKKTCQQHCFSTLNHNLAYCYNDARVIKFVWTNLIRNPMKGGARSFEDLDCTAAASADRQWRRSSEGTGDMRGVSFR